jgi:hypothetical protein
MPDAEAARALPLLVERAGRRWATFTRFELSAAAVELVAAAGKAVDFDAVVAAASSGIVEPRSENDLSALASPAPSYDAANDRGRFLELVWHEVSRLPLRQRVALLLNLRDSGGGGLLWLLPIAEWPPSGRSPECWRFQTASSRGARRRDRHWPASTPFQTRTGLRCARRSMPAQPRYQRSSLI